jgi:hypothetical protein
MTQTMYVRFGEAPASGQSANAETDELEAGVSCYRAEWQNSDRDVICLYVPNDESAGTAGCLEGRRPLYLVEGELVGTGGDGEPLLTNVTCIELDCVEVINYCIEADDE